MARTLDLAKRTQIANAAFRRLGWHQAVAEKPYPRRRLKGITVSFALADAR